MLLTDEEIEKLTDSYADDLKEPGEIAGYCDGLGDGAKAQLKKIYEWGNGPCPHKIGLAHKRCGLCWQALLEEVSEAPQSKSRGIKGFTNSK